MGGLGAVAVLEALAAGALRFDAVGLGLVTAVLVLEAGDAPEALLAEVAGRLAVAGVAAVGAGAGVDVTPRRLLGAVLVAGAGPAAPLVGVADRGLARAVGGLEAGDAAAGVRVAHGAGRGRAALGVRAAAAAGVVDCVAGRRGVLTVSCREALHAAPAAGEAATGSVVCAVTVVQAGDTVPGELVADRHRRRAVGVVEAAAADAADLVAAPILAVGVLETRNAAPALEVTGRPRGGAVLVSEALDAASRVLVAVRSVPFAAQERSAGGLEDLAGVGEIGADVFRLGALPPAASAAGEPDYEHPPGQQGGAQTHRLAPTRPS